MSGADGTRFVVLGDFESPRLCIGSHSEVRGGRTDPHRWLVRLQTNDMRAEVARLKGAGVPFVEEPNDLGGGFWLTTCKDPEGNLVQLNYWDPGARERGTRTHAGLRDPSVDDLQTVVRGEATCGNSPLSTT